MSDFSTVNKAPIFLKKSDSLRVLYPPKKHSRSIASFHPKLMLVRFSDKLRVVVSSANASSGDWMFWANCFVKIDCPRLDTLGPKSLLAFDSGSIERAQSAAQAETTEPQGRATAKPAPEVPDESVSESLASHRRALVELGYSFGGYLKRYLELTMGDKHGELGSFLQIDLDEFDLDRSGLFLVGSLPGAFANRLHYSSPELLELGEWSERV